VSISSLQPSTDPARAELRLPANVSAPALARHTVQDLLGGLPYPLRAQLSLVASELVTNVLRHCSEPDPTATLTLALTRDRVTLTVSDPGAGFDPGNVTRSDDPAGGWGLQVLDAIADRWWVEHDGANRVICEIDR
jgi:serine/threonine-protein kinase RsbW